MIDSLNSIYHNWYLIHIQWPSFINGTMIWQLKLNLKFFFAQNLMAIGTWLAFPMIFRGFKTFFIILIWKIFEVEKNQKVLISLMRYFCLFFNLAKENGDDLNLCRKVLRSFKLFTEKKNQINSNHFFVCTENKTKYYLNTKFSFFPFLFIVYA